MTASDFNWLDDPDIIVGEQRALAVYQNSHGNIVIRQERAWDEDEDIIIVLRRENAERVARAILAATGFNAIEAPPPIAAQIESKSSGATRQARYRERKRKATVTRNGVTRCDVTAVTPRDGRELFSFDTLAPLHQKETATG